jgi:hypothetical protein
MKGKSFYGVSSANGAERKRLKRKEESVSEVEILTALNRGGKPESDAKQ